MADLNKQDKGGLGLAIVCGLIVIAICCQLKGGQDGCRASGRTPHGIECLDGGKP